MWQNEKRYKKEETGIFVAREHILEDKDYEVVRNCSNKMNQKLNASHTKFLDVNHVGWKQDLSFSNNEHVVIERWKDHFKEHLNYAEGKRNRDKDSTAAGVIQNSR